MPPKIKSSEDEAPDEIHEKDLWPLLIVLISGWSAFIFGVYAYLLTKAAWLTDWRWAVIGAYAGSLAFWFTLWAAPRLPKVARTFFGPLRRGERKEAADEREFYLWPDNVYRTSPPPGFTPTQMGQGMVPSSVAPTEMPGSYGPTFQRQQG